MSWVVNDARRRSSSGNPRGPAPRRQNRIARLAQMFSSRSLSISQGSISGEHAPTEHRSRNVFVVGENNEVVQHLKEVLPNVPYQVPVADRLDDADNVLLVVETATFSSDDVKAALQAFKKHKKKLMILYLTREGRDVEAFLKQVPKKYASVQDVEWVPYLTSDLCQDYQHAAIETVLQTYNLIETVSHDDKWDFFVSHRQVSSQGVAADVYSQLQSKGLRVWWDVKAENLSVSGMMNGVAKSDNFILLLTKDTLDSYYVQLEVEQAIKYDKNIVVLYDLRMNFGGDKKIQLVSEMIQRNQKHRKELNISATWIPIDMKKHFSGVMVNQLLEACGMVAPNSSLNATFQSVKTQVINGLEGSTFQAAREFHQGTRQWILDRFETWSSTSTGNKVFAVTGQAGIGKTTLSAEIILRGRQDPSPSKPRIVAFHYFDHQEPDGAASARNALFGICYQLRAAIPGFRAAMDSQISPDTDVSKWNNLHYLLARLIVKPANQISKFYPDTHPRQIIVLDALDECTQGQELKQVLFDAWRSNAIPSWLGLCVTCRPEIIDFYTSEVEADNNGITMLITDDERNKSDVRIVLSNWLRGLTDEESISKIVDRSEGVFLYLRFVKEMIDKFQSNHPGEKFTTVAQFPKGLGGYYKRYFTRLYDVVGEELFQRLLGSILASRGPLPLELWMRSCGVEGDLDDDTRTDTTFERFDAAMKICKSLMHIPPSLEHAGITFIHKSIPDYLTRGRNTEGSALQRTEEKKFHIPARGSGCNALLEQVQHVFQHPDEPSATLTKKYSYHNLFALLCGAERTDEAQAMLFDLNSILTWLAGASSTEVIQDILQKLPHTSTQQADVQVMLKLLKLGQRALVAQGIERISRKQFPSQLPSQILGRLSEQSVANRPNLRKLRDAANRYDPGLPWLKPASANLDSALPGGLVQTLQGHSDSVSSVAFNSDGTRIVSGSDDSTIRIWDAITGEPIGEPLQGHSSSVSSVAFNADGTRIVSGSDDKTIRIWDAVTGQPIGEPLQGHSDSVWSVAFNSDGTRIVSGSRDETIRIWDAITGEPIGEPLQGHSSWVSSVAFNSDGTRIVSGSHDNTIRIWDAITGQPIGEPLQGHSDSVWSVAFNSDGTRIVSGSHDNTIRIWDAITGEPIGEPLQGHSDSVWSVAFNSDGTRIVSGSDDETIRIWDAITGEPIGEPLQGHSDSVWSVAFNSDGTRIVSGSDDETIRIWDAVTGEPIGEPLQGHSDSVWSVAFNSDGTRIVSGSWDKTIRIWDAITGEPIGEPLQGHSDSVWSVAFNSDGTRIVSGSHDNTIRIWDAITGEPIGEPLQGHSSWVSSVAFNSDGTRIVSGSSDKTIQIWDTITGEPIGEPLQGHSDSVKSVAFNSDGTRIVSGSWDKTIRIWDAITGEPIGEPLQGHSSSVSSVAFNSDGTRIVSGSRDKTIRIWDAVTGQPIGEPLQGHSDSVRSVAFNSDGTRIVSGSDDKTIRIWDAITGEPIGELHRMPVKQLANFNTLPVNSTSSTVSFGGSNSIGFTLDHGTPGNASRIHGKALICCVSDNFHRLHILYLSNPD